MRALLLRISGIVQGVGFRPFIHRLALETGVKGYVKNLGGGEVEVWVEGEERNVQEFVERLFRDKPPTAEIEDVVTLEVEPRGFKEFKILKSSSSRKKISMIPPDFAICDECMKEVLDPKSRWYMYPFNSCAWCGPRFSMIYRVPYDRENTAMRKFPLCDECLREYSDVNNIRRYHAQGISCPRCGPKLQLYTSDGKPIEVDDPIGFAAEKINEGFIVAVKGIGGFHIAALATDDGVVLELRRRKRRPQKPFALMALDLETVRRIAVVSELEEKVLKSYVRPIVLLRKRGDSPVSEYVAPGLDRIGVMLPYTALHYMLLSRIKDRFAIMTSANPSGLPMCTSEDCVFKMLSKVVDYVLAHNREIVNRVDDSVVKVVAGRTVIIRRGRGYAPRWVKTAFAFKKPVVAFGADLNNACAVAVDRYVILTQYIGDLENLETVEFMKKALKFLLDTYGVKLSDAIIACDMHPRYTSSAIAEEYAKAHNAKLVKIQHHHAHIVSAMVEQGVEEGSECVGVAIDGVGYGTDGSVWGGEVMLVTYESFTRVGHLAHAPLVGGDVTVEYPARMLYTYLEAAFGREEATRIFTERRYVDMLKYGEKELKAIQACLDRGSYVKSSSTGRFLDAVSAALRVCWIRTFEGEPPMKLEAAASRGRNLGFEFKVIGTEPPYVIDVIDAFRSFILDDKYRVEDVAYTVLYELGRALAKIAKRYLKDRVYVSGGAAVNEFILKGMIEELGDECVYVNTKVPPGDGGLALGQAAIAYFRALREGLLE